MLVIDRPKYKMSIIENKKEVHVQVIGFIKEEIVEQYLIDLQHGISQVQKFDYSLIVDATYQSPVPYKVAAELGDTMMTYATLGFKNIFIVNPKSKIAFVQVRNALETKNFPGKIVNHLSEIKN